MIGKPGAGKTLVTLQTYILPALLAGRTVYHNIPGLDVVKIAHYLRNKHNRKDITPYYAESLLYDYSIETLLASWREIFPAKRTAPGAKRANPSENDVGIYYLNAIPKAPSGSLIVLDEAQKHCYINSKDWNTEKNKKFFEYCSVHRKSKHEVLIITQDDQNIDSSVNGIREELIFLLRQERVGLKNRVKLKYYLGHQTIKNKPYATTAVNYDKAVFDLYDSYTANPTNAQVKEIRRVPSVFFSGKFIALALVGVFLVMCNGSNSLRLFKGEGGLSNPKGKKPVSGVSSSSFSLGDYEEYYCGDKFYVLRPGGKIDTLQPKNIPPSYCPSFGFIRRGAK